MNFPGCISFFIHFLLHQCIHRPGPSISFHRAVASTSVDAGARRVQPHVEVFQSSPTEGINAAVPLLHCSWVPDDGQWQRLEATVSRAHQLSAATSGSGKTTAASGTMPQSPTWTLSHYRHFTEFALIEPQTPPVQLWCGRSELVSNLTFRH